MKFRNVLTATVLTLIFGARIGVRAQSLTDSIATLAAPAQGRVGVFLMNIETGDSCMSNGHAHLPMLSVYKFPLALYVLDQVDKGKLSLDAPVDIDKKEWESMFSPLLNKYSKEHFSLPLREVLTATVGSSDNVGCDLIFRMVGGPAVVNRYIHALGIEPINIVYTEMQMAADWNKQYENWCEPAAMGQLLKLFYTGKILSDANTKLLLKIMTESTSPKRIQGLLPANAITAHKTGTSNTNEAGITAATNDVGIVTLPNGQHLIVVAYVSDAKADQATREGVISKISLAGYNHYAR